MNHPTGKLPAYLGYLLIISPVIFFTYVMATKVIPYLSFEQAVNFLSTKTDEVLAQPLFRAGFYIHIISSWIVLLVALPQFLPLLSARQPGFHRFIGSIYVFTILAFAAPSGLVLALYANGGIAAKTGFTLQCLVWWFATFMAYVKVRQHNYREHITWMVRSFAVTLAAFSLRTEGYLMHYLLHTRPIETYVTITWLSWVGNWFIAELLLTLGLGKWLHKKYTQNLQP